MTDLYRHAHRIKELGYGIQEFAESLAGQMNAHDRNNEKQWIELAMITADYALYIYKKSPEIVRDKLLEHSTDTKE